MKNYFLKLLVLHTGFLIALGVCAFEADRFHQPLFYVGVGVLLWPVIETGKEFISEALRRIALG